MFTNDGTIQWVESLADQELRIDSGERASFDVGSAKQDVLSVETALFIRNLHAHFQFTVELFNRRLQRESLHVRLLRCSQPREGFSLERNGMRLIWAFPKPGIAQFQGEKQVRNENGTPRCSVMFSGVVEAKFGPFDEVEWEFLGSRVTGEQLARHTFTELIQASRSQKG